MSKVFPERYPDEVRQKAVDLMKKSAKEGMTITEASQTVSGKFPDGPDSTTILGWAKKAGIGFVSGQRRYSEEDRAKFVARVDELLAEGVSVRSACRQAAESSDGPSTESIHNWYKEAKAVEAEDIPEPPKKVVDKQPKRRDDGLEQRVADLEIKNLESIQRIADLEAENAATLRKYDDATHQIADLEAKHKRLKEKYDLLKPIAAHMFLEEN
ncbi:hypothetical protein [Nocardia jiangxiensis]|uniref:hypothetical protein n=1 Tax=Nocardia jiangxiensis TaxID=282685 RepID=UPI0003149897|nr:hypothetical protein [Nocardia jiangxiensis]